MLKEAMIEVMASDSSPLQKADAVARLGALYLKAYGAADLKQANALLMQRVAELERRLATVEPPNRDPAAGGGRLPRQAQRSHPGGAGNRSPGAVGEKTGGATAANGKIPSAGDRGGGRMPAGPPFASPELTPTKRRLRQRRWRFSW